MYSEREWLAHVDRFGWRCQYCGTALTTQREGENRALLTKDHIVPISTGGADEIPNLLPACLRCNRMKKNKRLENWLRERPRLTRFYTENRQVLSILEKERKKQKQKLDEVIRNLACHVAFPVDTHFRSRQTEFLFPKHESRWLKTSGSRGSGEVSPTPLTKLTSTVPFLESTPRDQ